LLLFSGLRMGERLPGNNIPNKPNIVKKIGTEKRGKNWSNYDIIILVWEFTQIGEGFEMMIMVVSSVREQGYRKFTVNVMHSAGRGTTTKGQRTNE
jgi:predicted DCC family thiol-disulfide oxidoreductase YuxK